MPKKFTSILNLGTTQEVIKKLIIPYIIFASISLCYYLLQYHFILFAFIGLFVGLSCFLIVLILLGYSKTKAQIIWACFNFTVCIWSLACFFIGLSESNLIKVGYFWKMHNLGLIFIPVFLYHFVNEFLHSKETKILFLVYAQALIFLGLNLFTNHFANEYKYYYNEFYYLQATKLFTLFLVIFTIISVRAFVKLAKFHASTVSLKRIQSAYLLYGMLVGFVGGFSLAPLAYGINFYPAGLFLVGIYAGVSAYAICRYQLVDIKVVITRTGIFIAVYSFVLGIPFAIAFSWQNQLRNLMGENWWIFPLGSSTILATAGPFLYLYIQKRAEDRLFQEQRRYQTTLRQASYGMGRIKDIHRLLDLIVHIVNRTIGLEHTIVYVNDPGAKKFVLGAKRSKDIRFQPIVQIELDSPLVQHLQDFKRPVVYEEVKQLTQDYGDRKLAMLETNLVDLNAEVVVPSFIDERLLAIIVFGKRSGGKFYNEDDLAVFTILANQAALAIENAQFYEDMKQAHEQLFKAEKMATIGTMADGLSHQINNRFHALGFIAGDAMDSIKMKKEKIKDPELQELMIDVEHALNRIQENIMQGGEIVRGLLKYTRKGEEGFQAVDLNHLITASVEMTQFKIRPGELSILREFPADLPKIKGNFTQLQEVMFNMIDNAYDAMMQRKNELKEAGFKPVLKISASSGPDGFIDVTLEDNGIGVKEEDKEKLFTPFFTTKVSSNVGGKKGTGLGLYVIQKLIEEYHNGKVRYESEYKKGTRAWLHLPKFA